MIIEIDSKSGFCFGVVNAIKQAEKELDTLDQLFCLGDIVHNSVEVDRLEKNGLKTVTYEEFRNLKNCKVLIRAHGEPPETYETAKRNNITLVDASCPVVLKLQKKIKNGFEQMIKMNGQVVIYGKQGHAEVNGLVGQTNGQAIVVSGLDDLNKIDFTRPVAIYSQTTKSTEGYKKLVEEIKKRSKEKGLEESCIIVNNTICGQVSQRNSELKKFAEKHEVIVFVSDKKSSNGKVLYDVCKEHNENSYFVSEINEVKKEWFSNVNSVGICGATSTPRWFMEQVRDFINGFTKISEK